jgi:TRAP-type C4-dicarboxylate transport system permease small subunit
LGAFRLAAVSAALNRAAAAVAAAALAALILLIVLQVVRRRVLGAPIVYTDEVSGYLLVVLTFLGLGYAMQHGDHIRVEILTGRLAGPALRALRVAWCLVGLAFTGLLAVRTAALALDSARLSAFSIVAQIPLAPIQAVAPAGFLLIFLQLLVQLVDAVRSRP